MPLRYNSSDLDSETRKETFYDREIEITEKMVVCCSKV